MHKLRQTFSGAGILLVLVLLSACNLPGTSGRSPDAVYTAAAETAQARLTEHGPVNPTASNTPQPIKLPTQPTQPPAIQPPAVTQAAAAPSPTTAAVDDRAEWVTQTPADNSNVTLATAFTTTWTLKNTGKTTWSTVYQLRYFGGEKFGAPDSVRLPHEVKPDQQVNIAVNMVAPSKTGEYKTVWVLTNAQGVNFYPVDLTVRVVAAPSATITPTQTQTATVEPTPY